jgi:hypothetical protein
LIRRTILAALAVATLAVLGADAQVNPQNLPSGTVYGRLQVGSSGPGQAIPFAIFTGNLLSALSGDCTATSAGAITCTKTNGVAFGTAAAREKIEHGG